MNNIRRAFVIDADVSLHRTEVPEVPMDAIREALFNAFCHRVYETNAAVQVDIFWDKVDVYSPGGFPPGVSPESYLSGESAASSPRNVRIAQTLYRSGDIEAYGTGLQRIKRSCDAQGTPVEVFERGNSVHVVFTRQEALDDSRRLGPFAAGSTPKAPDNGRQVADSVPVGSEDVPKSSEEFRSGSEEDLRLDKSEQAISDLLRATGPMRTAQIAEAVDMTPRGTLKVLNRLIAKGIVSAQGNTSSRTYALRDS